MTDRQEETDHSAVFQESRVRRTDHLADLLRLPDRISAGTGRHRHDPGGRQPGDDHVGVRIHPTGHDGRHDPSHVRLFVAGRRMSL